MTKPFKINALLRSRQVLQSLPDCICVEWVLWCPRRAGNWLTCVADDIVRAIEAQLKRHAISCEYTHPAGAVIHRVGTKHRDDRFLVNLKVVALASLVVISGP